MQVLVGFVSSFIEDHLTSKVLFNQKSSSIEGHLSSKVVFHRKLSTMEGGLVNLVKGLNSFLLRYKQNSFGCFQRNSELIFFFKNTQNCFAYNSVTKYRSEAVLYSKRSAGYFLSPHIKTIAVAFLLAE